MLRSRSLRLLSLSLLLVACGDDAEGPAQDAEVDDDAQVEDAGADDTDAGKSAVGDAGKDAGRSMIDPTRVDDAGPDFGKPAIKPDVPVTKVTSCMGQPDMTLCDVVTMPDRWYDICVSGTCVSPGSCNDKSCQASGPHFRIPPMSGHAYLQKQAGEEPITIDLITGLHWQSCAAGLTGAACSNGKLLELDLNGALAYCDSLTWGGKDDWYLPDMHELMSIVDIAVEMPGLGYYSEAAFPNRKANTGFFWSTSRVDRDMMTLSTGKNVGSYPSIAWAEWFATDSNDVFCVRRGFSLPMPMGERFVSHKEDPKQPWVEDRATGLSIQYCSSVEGAGNCDVRGTFASAEGPAHCSQLSWAGHDDWRLPTYKEAHALFEYSKSGTFDHGVSDKLFAISGTYLLVNNGPLFDVTDSTRTGIGSAGTTYPVLCVRGPTAP